jgi:hypothetical protein
VDHFRGVAATDEPLHVLHWIRHHLRCGRWQQRGLCPDRQRSELRGASFAIRKCNIVADGGAPRVVASKLGASLTRSVDPTPVCPLWIVLKSFHQNWSLAVFEVGTTANAWGCAGGDAR